MRDVFASHALQRDVPLAPLTTFRIGGPARYFRRAGSIDEIAAALRWARTRGITPFVLGGGSNVVVSDSGFDGLVLQVVPRGLEVVSEGRHVVVRAAAGEEWSTVVEACLARNLAGIECLAGIPGLTGGVPIQNVGAYGQEIADTLVSVEAMDRKTMRSVRFDAAQCILGYRRSRFNTEDAGRFIVTHVSIRLEKGGAPTLGYPAVREAVLARHGPAATLRQVADTVVSIRRTKSMVVDESDVCSRSAGSFFLNPIVDRPALERTRARAALHDLDPKRMPVRDAGPERWKLSSAWLIEQSGFPKGFRMGNAAVSPKHPLALVNAGGATAEEVVRLARTIRAGVQRKFEIDLSPEPVFVGWNDDPLRAGADA